MAIGASDQDEFILGVVGWVDLQAEDLPQQLKTLTQDPKLAGIRHVVQDEPDDEFMLRPEFRRGISRLREFDLTYDLLLYPKHLRAAIRLVEEFPTSRLSSTTSPNQRSAIGCSPMA